MNKPQI